MTASKDQTFIGIDIGGTFTRLAIVDGRGRVLTDRRTETPNLDDRGETLLEWLERHIDVCTAELDDRPAPLAIGVGVPGILEPQRSAIIRAVNLPFLEGVPLRDALVERTGLRTVLDSDAVAGAWGEFCLRQRIIKRMIYLTIGTGIGGAVLIDGQPLRHTHHGAGHVGHLVCDSSPNAPRCRCGAQGCLEAVAAGPALQAAARSQGFTTLADVELAYQEGEARADRFLNRAADPLAIGLVTLAHLYPVDLVVVGGGVAAALPTLIRRAAELAAQRGGDLIPPKMRVELPGLGEETGVVGAALLAAESEPPSPPS